LHHHSSTLKIRKLTKNIPEGPESLAGIPVNPNGNGQDEKRLSQNFECRAAKCHQFLKNFQLSTPLTAQCGDEQPRSPSGMGEKYRTTQSTHVVFCKLYALHLLSNTVLKQPIKRNPFGSRSKMQHYRGAYVVFCSGEGLKFVVTFSHIHTY